MIRLDLKREKRPFAENELAVGEGIKENENVCEQAVIDKE